MANIDKKLLKKKEKIFMGDDYKLLVPLAEEFKQYDMAEAVKILKYCLKKQPDYMSAHVSLGKIYMESGYAESAIEEFERVVGAIPSNILSHRKLAALYAQTGQKEKAIIANDRILALNTGDREALEAIKSLTENPSEGIDDIENTDNIEDVIAASLAADDHIDTIATEPDTSSEDTIILDDITEEILSDSGDQTKQIEGIEDAIAASLAWDDHDDTVATEPDTFLEDITAETLSESGSEGGKAENLFYIDDTIVVNAGDLAEDSGFILSPNEPVTMDDEDDTETITTKASVDSPQLQNDGGNVSWDPFAEPPAPLSGNVNDNDVIIELTSVDYVSMPDNDLTTESSAQDTETQLSPEDISDMEIISDSEMKALVLDKSNTDEELVVTANFDSDVDELMASISITYEMETISDTDEAIENISADSSSLEMETISDTDEAIEKISADSSSLTDGEFQDEELVVKEEIEMIENYILTERFLSAIKAYTQLQERFPTNLVIKSNLDNLRQSARLMDKDENALIRKLDFLKNRLKEKVQDVYAGPAYN
ncbi:tetratricopeptide repeat protein [Candidatus Magnetomonas plexicatena]|uniref:tetratricopeptide repeat protein n=1 Tax=Candidatus Magnetomonas plexicatena TaxID=2552947 RepID=UPI001C79A1A1|nr:hypothetical protein E2O03_013895 [Nitrospirales bacterium LBB_01]